MPIALLLVAASLAQTEEVAEKSEEPLRRIGIFDINTEGGLDEELQQMVIDTLANAVGATGRYEVVSRTELEAILSAEAVQIALGCLEVSCLVEIGLAAGIESMLAGSISEVDGALIINLQLIDVTTTDVENRTSLDWRGSEADLAGALAVAAQLLVIPEEERSPGIVQLTGNPADGMVTVDGELRGAGPVRVDELAVGIHQLSIDAPGHEQYLTPFLVKDGATTQLAIELTRSEPFWKKWWFWTAVGVTVVAGVTTGVLLGRKDDSGTVSFRTAAPGVLP